MLRPGIEHEPRSLMADERNIPSAQAMLIKQGLHKMRRTLHPRRLKGVNTTLPRNFIGGSGDMLFIDRQIAAPIDRDRAQPHGHHSVLLTERSSGIVDEHKPSIWTDDSSSGTITYAECVPLGIIHITGPVSAAHHQGISAMSSGNGLPGMDRPKQEIAEFAINRYHHCTLGKRQGPMDSVKSIGGQIGRDRGIAVETTNLARVHLCLEKRLLGSRGHQRLKLLVVL